MLASPDSAALVGVLKPELLASVLTEAELFAAEPFVASFNSFNRCRSSTIASI